MPNRSISELRLLTKVSSMYYDDGLKQEEIVDRLHLSKSKVSRLLQRARDEGIVKTYVISPPGIFSEIESRLESKYRINEVIITDVREPNRSDVLSRDLGIAAAGYFSRVIEENDVVGIAWGYTINGMVGALEPRSYPNVKIVQLTGGIGKPESENYATELCHKMARTLSCKLALLPAPGVVKDRQMREVFMADNQIQQVFNLFSKISLAFVGIGSPDSHTFLSRDVSIFTQSDLEKLISGGAVGDVALRFFNKEGQFLETGLDEQIIGIGLEILRAIPRLVGVAGGQNKVDAIRGALLSGILDVLITDRNTAESLV